MTETDEILKRVRDIFSEPNGPFYGSDITPMVGDLCDEVERLRRESRSRWARSENWRRHADERLQLCMRFVDALKGLRHKSGDYCFCQKSIDNPMFKDHSEACKRAVSVLNEIEGV